MNIIRCMQLFWCLYISGISFAYASGSKDDEHLVYVGLGSAQTGDSLKSNTAPSSIGYMHFSNTKDFIWGLDLGGEGTMLESKGATTTIKQSTSFNFLMGKNFSKTENNRFDMAFLFGMRQSSSTCPTSYLGYECYADQPPQTRYSINFGGVATFTYKSVMLGLRATGESTQALIGIRF